jgi:hypothetical protein
VGEVIEVPPCAPNQNYNDRQSDEGATPKASSTPAPHRRVARNRTSASNMTHLGTQGGKSRLVCDCGISPTPYRPRNIPCRSAYVGF